MMVEFEPVINRLQDWCLSEDNHHVLMTIAIESDLLAQKLNFAHSDAIGPKLCNYDTVVAH